MVGDTIGHYRILESVGRGGMGVVYKALDVDLDRTVAVKVLSAELREDPEFVERFRHEARIQAALNHPNVAMLFEFLVWNGSPVAVMEFIQGETLQRRLQRDGAIPAHVAIPLFIQALRGVAAGHRRGIIHRDLKPANLMITDEEVVKVTDFGIAKVQSSTGLTQASTRIGSSSYMSPEQILGRPVDVRTDIYAMGVTLYEMLCGRPPFAAKTSFEIESAHVRDIPVPPVAYCAQIPRPAVDAVMRALAKDPDERFATAEEFIQALPDLHGVPYFDPDATKLRSEPITSSAAATVSATDLTLLRPQSQPVAPAPALTPTTGPTPARSWKTGIAGGIAAVVVLAGAASWWLMTRTPPPHHTSDTRAQETQPEAPATNRPQQSIEPQVAQTPVPPVTQAAHPPLSVGQPPGRQEQGPPKVVHVTPRQAITARSTLGTSRDLTGVWTGVYSDAAGHTQLRVVDLQIRQVADGNISGSLTYKTDTDEEATCTLEKSSYSKERKRLRLVVHCRNPSHPRYLNVPLNFVDVDPGTNSLQGGKLEFHLADEIVVSLRRMRSA